MERRRFTREFKLEAVKLIRDRGVASRRHREDLRVHGDGTAQLGEGVRGRSAACLSGPRADEARAGRDRAAEARSEKLKAERDILKKAAAYFAKELT